jgi:hypothetical protein
LEARWSSLIKGFFYKTYLNLEMAFIQLLKCEETERLLRDHTNEFLLLTLIAYRAKRTNSPIGLGIGQAYIGDYRSCGLTRQKYRNALKNLEEWKFLTIKATNKGTIVTLLNSIVFDINREKSNQPATNQQPTSNQPATTNNKIIRQEDKKKPLVEIPFSLNTPAFLKSWDEFVQYRKHRRMPLTELAAKKNMKVLEHCSAGEAIAVIDKTIANNWRGLFENENGKYKKGTGEDLNY